ncbi:MAG TPA: cobyrinate a,c-diamide synthase, partial [Spirochaetota bacterium]|nr:cobyrinate a,c-diamide synthase [Spirochaetota bacterium]
KSKKMKSDTKPNIHRAIAIGGTRGASGKTIVTLGLIRMLVKHGYSIAPFKKGPDYIDPQWLSLGAGNPCRNLDSFLMDDDTIRDSFTSLREGTDISVIEGNRGLFDGLDIKGTYSFAELVKLLDIPLILVVDCKKASRSVAAVIHGFQTFDPDLRIHGVIINNFAGMRHKKIITETIETHCKIPVLGAIPRITDFMLDERHLGLEPIHEHRNPEQVLELIDKVFADAINIEEIIRISESIPLHNNRSDSTIILNHDDNVSTAVRCGAHGNSQTRINPAPAVSNISLSRKRTGIIRDSSFNFYYIESLELFEHHTEVRYINSLSDATLPDIDSLYIGGGFPETHAKQLSANTALRNDIRTFVERGFPVYAECGGLIYLSQAIISEKNEFPMVGIFPYQFKLTDKPVGHGYTTFQVDKDNPFYQTGSVVKGHEFRYSRIINAHECKDVPTAFAMLRGQGIMDKRDGSLYKNTLATFSHTHPFSYNAMWMKHCIE